MLRRVLIRGLVSLVGAVLAATALHYVGGASSTSSYFGWIAFFVALQSPAAFGPEARACSAWLHRLTSGNA